MELELLILAIAFVIPPVAWLASAQRRFTAARALDRYAQSRGLLYEPGSGRTGPRVRATQEGVELVVELYRLSGNVRTRVRAVATHGEAPILSVAKRGAFRWSEEAVVATGDEAFDEAWVITAGAGDDGERLRSIAKPLGVVGERDGVWLASSGMRVSLSWHGVESDPLVLDAAQHAVSRVARWHRRPSPYR